MGRAQSMPRKDMSKVRATARRLISAAQQPALHVLESSVELSDVDMSITIIPCRSQTRQVIAGVLLLEGQQYWMVRSPKFCYRWYVVTFAVRNTSWLCSSQEVPCANMCVERVKKFRAEQTLSCSHI